MSIRATFSYFQGMEGDMYQSIYLFFCGRNYGNAELRKE